MADTNSGQTPKRRLVTLGPPSSKPPSLWQEARGHIISLIIGGILASIGFVGKERYSESRTRRLAAQQELSKELSPQVKKCIEASLNVWALGAVRDTSSYWLYTPDSLPQIADAEKACNFAVKKDPELSARLLTGYNSDVANLFKRFGSSQDDFLIASRKFLTPIAERHAHERSAFDSLYTRFDDLGDTLRTKLITEIGK